MPVPRPNPLHLLAGLALWCTGCPEGSDARPASPESDWGDDGAYGESEDSAPVVFLNFGGVTLEHGPDDATQDLSTIIREPVVEVPPYDEPDSIQEVVFLVKRMWSRTDVVFVTQRPTRGDYAMVVVTPVDLEDPGSGSPGVAVIDCDDRNPRGIVFAYAEGPDGWRSPEELARAISREAAYGFGLDQVDDPRDIMSSSGEPGSEFVDTCVPVGEFVGCPDTGLCPAGMRNSLAQLVDVTSTD